MGRPKRHQSEEYIFDSDNGDRGSDLLLKRQCDAVITAGDGPGERTASAGRQSQWTGKSPLGQSAGDVGPSEDKSP
jgi:hypothetical protein